MNKPQKALSLSAWAATSLIALGCAPAYHSYPCGCVSLCYAPAPPLPYTTYHACPTPIAACFQSHAAGEAPSTPPQLEPPPEPIDAPPVPPQESGGG